jgi:hypothetical protein
LWPALQPSHSCTRQKKKGIAPLLLDLDTPPLDKLGDCGSHCGETRGLDAYPAAEIEEVIDTHAAEFVRVELDDVSKRQLTEPCQAQGWYTGSD